MAGSRRKSNATTISYQEVDSDVDMQDEDRQVEASKVETARKKARKTGKMVKQEAKEEKESDSFSLEIFLGAPLDILGEICSHLDPQDLVKLARTSKLFHSLLLSRSSRSIWLAARRAANLPELKGQNEINYALLLYGSTCTTCGEEGKTVTPDFVLRTRFCATCRMKTLTSNSKLKKLVGLHPQATDCVPSTHLGSHGHAQDWTLYYPTRDLLKVSDTLNELQEEDDLAQDEWQSGRRNLGTRSRKPKQSTAASTERPLPAVEVFVKEQASQARLRVMEGQLVDETLKRNKKEKAELALAANMLVWKNLKIDLEVAEWLDDEIEWYFVNVFDRVILKDRWLSTDDRRALLRPSLSCPTNDPEDWIAIKKQVEARIVKEEREKAEREAQRESYRLQRGRVQALRGCYDQLFLQQPDGHDTLTFPRFEPFKQLASVKPLWLPEDAATLVDEAWESSLPAINRDIAAYRPSLRVQAITTILAATRDVPINSFSTDPVDYPEDEYDEIFFQRITSLFFSSTDGEGIAPFPACFSFAPTTDYAVYLRAYLQPLHVNIIRALLEAAGFDEETATIEDFNELGAVFIWPAHPRKTSRKTRHMAGDLMDDVYSRYRWNRQPCPELEFKMVASPKRKKTVKEEPISDVEDEQVEDVNEMDESSASLKEASEAEQGSEDEDEE